MLRKYHLNQTIKNKKKSRFHPRVSKQKPSYGNPPLESLVGPNAGECKEGMEPPCYNVDCERCKKDFEAKQPSIEERILIFNQSDMWVKMYITIRANTKATEAEKNQARSYISRINMCVENYRLFLENNIRTAAPTHLEHNDTTALMEITPCVSHALRMHQMYSIISRRV